LGLRDRGGQIERGGDKKGPGRFIVGSKTAKGKQEVIPSSLFRRSLGSAARDATRPGSTAFDDK